MNEYLGKLWKTGPHLAFASRKRAQARSNAELENWGKKKMILGNG